ncbi:MAG: hypothetical protein ABR577_18035 [Pyrinomonadaceae bacterium]
MEQHDDGKNETAAGGGASRVSDDKQSGSAPEDALEAEQESAEAMDADVPQPLDASKTTEGQPS